MNTPGIEVADGDQVLQTLDDHLWENVDFVDTHKWAWLAAQGMHVVALTFDQQRFSHLDGVTARVPRQNTA